MRWLSEPRKLSREQTRVLDGVTRSGECVAISDITLLEIAAIFRSGRHRMHATPAELLRTLELDPAFQILPITVDIATEVATMGGTLADPADRAIVATARVHRLRLLTSDQRIAASKLVAVID